jgi:uncharacterized SAM-dependent methyltransferase
LLGEPKTLSRWFLYDAGGSLLFEQITALPEYYLSRTERRILTDCASEIVSPALGRHRVMVAELGAGTVVKTGIFLSELVRRQVQSATIPLIPSNNDYQWPRIIAV